MKPLWRYGIFLSVLLSCGTQQKEDAKKIAETHNQAKFNDLEKKKDAQFVVDAAAFSLKQIRLFKMAQQNSIDSAVQSMGKTLAKEYTELYGLLKDLGLKKAITVPTELSKTDSEICEKLSFEIAGDFDKKLFGMASKDHEDAIKSHERIMLQSKDPKILLYAGSAIPKLKRNHAFISLTEKERPPQVR
jgi:putative membrane protein